MFLTRLISGIIVLAIAVAAMLLGGDVLFLFTMAITLIGLYELYKAAGIEKTWLGYLGLAGTVIYDLVMRFFPGGELMAAAVAALMIMSAYVFMFPKYKVHEAFSGLSGILYVTVLMSFIYKVRILPDGLYVIPMIFICAWGNDTCAYCVGMLLGKHKMFPVLSPKKSVEGFVGGIVGAAVLGLIYGSIFGTHLPSLVNPAVSCMVIGAVGALIAVVGDLSASAVKRDTGIKDYGRLIPGHGGILDRFDSILFTAPVVYILAVILGSFAPQL